MNRLLATLALLLASSIAPASEFRLPVKAFLCDTAEHARRFADAVAKGETEEMAKDRVGRAAGAEVCGLYRGVATIGTQEVRLIDGTAYKFTALRFLADRRLAWLAQRGFASGPETTDVSL